MCDRGGWPPGSARGVPISHRVARLKRHVAGSPTQGIEVLRDGATEWDACERSLAARGIRLPLPHRAAWRLARPRGESRFLPLRTAEGTCAGAFVVHGAASRAIPGFQVLRVERLGEALPRPFWPAAVDALAVLARREPRVLRLTVEVFSRDGDARAQLGELLARAGFVRAPTVRHWSTTLVLDLRPTETKLLASFSPSARRALRATVKEGLEVRLVDDGRLADRLEALSRETRARTGGRYESLCDWSGVIELSRRAPDASRLVGLFRTDQEGPSALIGFAWGWWNGQSVSYFAGASARPEDMPRVHIGYPLMWDLIVWAKREGATWFDFGGVTPGTAGSGDPVGGISDFKRLFSKETAEVADEWVLEPRKFLARVAAVASAAAAWLSRLAPLGSEWV